MANDMTRSGRSTGLVDVLDRVLDKGLVIAGDIRVSLAEVELLTIRIRLIVCSLDKAEAVGLDWWKHDRYFAPGNRSELAAQNDELRDQVRRLEAQVAALLPSGGAPGGSRVPGGVVPARASTSTRTRVARKK